MTLRKTSSGDTCNKYLKGATFWDNEGAFWRNNPLYSAKSKNYFEGWVRRLRTGEKQLTRLG